MSLHIVCQPPRPTSCCLPVRHRKRHMPADAACNAHTQDHHEWSVHAITNVFFVHFNAGLSQSAEACAVGQTVDCTNGSPADTSIACQCTLRGEITCHSFLCCRLEGVYRLSSGVLHMCPWGQRLTGSVLEVWHRNPAAAVNQPSAQPGAERFNFIVVLLTA